MKKTNVLGSLAMILMAIALLLENNNIVNDTVFSIIIGISLGLGILNIAIPCLKKNK